MVETSGGNKIVNNTYFIVYLENAWNSKQMITEGEAAILLETTRRAFGNQSQSKQRPTLVNYKKSIIEYLLKYYYEKLDYLNY